MNSKKIVKFVQIGALSSALSLMGAGAAWASSVENLGTTGPDSVNVITIDQNNNISTLNQNYVSVVNYSQQSAASGSANISGNTNSGTAVSGHAYNNSTASTVVAIANSGKVAGAVNGGGYGGGLPVTGGSGTTGGGARAGFGRGAGSQPISFGGKGGGLLPVTGPQDIVDVGALRALYKPTGEVVTDNNPVVKNVSKLSSSLLIGALLLTLTGTLASALYASKKTV